MLSESLGACDVDEWPWALLQQLSRAVVIPSLRFGETVMGDATVMSVLSLCFLAVPSRLQVSQPLA